MASEDYEDGSVAAAIDEHVGGLVRALRDLGNGNAATPMGALEALGTCVTGVGEQVGSGLSEIATNLADALDTFGTADAPVELRVELGERTQGLLLRLVMALERLAPP
jgi:hypothetical protein